MSNPVGRLVARLTGREGKASATRGSFATMYGTGEPVWTPRDYEQLASEGYMTAVWVFACVREITASAKQVPLIVQRVRAGGKVEELSDGPLVERIARPNPWQAGPAFREAELAYRLLSGNSYTEKVGPTNGPPLELYQLRPDRIRVVLDRKGYPAAYEWNPGGGATPVQFDARRVMHVRTFHPLDDHYGMSVIEAAARGVDMFNAGMSHNTALLQNQARPSGALVSEGTLTEAQFDRLRDEIDRMLDVTDRRGRPMLLEAGLKWLELGMSPKDMDWREGSGDAARQIHAAFGVHPVITGLQEGTYENQDQAQRQLLTRVVLPMLEHYLAELNAHVVPAFASEGETLRVAIDRDGIEALSDDRDKLWSRVTKAKTSGILTVNEAREALGYDTIDGGDELDQGLAGMLKSDAPQLEAKAGGDPAPAPDPLEEAKAARWRAFDGNVTSWERAIEREVGKAFDAEREELVGRLRTAGSLAGVETLVSETVTGAGMRKTLEEGLLAIMLAFGRDTRGELLKSSSGPAEAKRANARGVFGVVFDEVLTWAKLTAADHVVSITNTTKESIRSRVVAALDEGDSVDTLARSVDELYLEQIIPNRSRVIARTETASAANKGSHFAARATGLKLRKEWLATRDGRTREAHALADGQEAPLDDPFDVGGELLQHPGDASLGASAANIIQCRCTTVYTPLD